MWIYKVLYFAHTKKKIVNEKKSKQWSIKQMVQNAKKTSLGDTLPSATLCRLNSFLNGVVMQLYTFHSTVKIQNY